MHEEKMKSRSMTLSCGIELYEGNYFNSQYGDLTIIFEENVLTASIGLLKVGMTPYPKPNSMRIELIPGSGKVMEFISDEECKEVSALSYMGVHWRRTGAE